MGSFLLMACSAVPVKMQCSEIQARIDYGDLTGDQLRFAVQELEDCRARQQDAEAKDSAFVDGAEKQFTPDSETESGPASTTQGKEP